MKQYLFLLLCYQTMVYTDFILQIIENKSDLTFEYAYQNLSGKQTTLKTLTDQLQKYKDKQHLVLDKPIKSQGLALVLSDQQGHQAKIFMHDQASYSIQTHRSKIKSIAQFPQISPQGKGPYVAQIMIQDGADQKLLGDPKAYLHQQDARFNLEISGQKGDYQISLTSITK